MRHAKIRKKAQLIDKLVDVFKKGRGRKTFPHETAQHIVPLIFPNSHRLGRGFFKSAFYVSSTNRDLVLKLANHKYIRREFKLYLSIPRGVRNRYFAKIYWRTKYCLLQKYGKDRKLPPEVLKTLRAKARRFGLSDIRPDNIRAVEGRFKIVDANPA